MKLEGLKIISKKYQVMKNLRIYTENEILDYEILYYDSLEKNNVLSYGGNSIYSHNKIPEKIFKINKKYGGDNFSYDEYINQLEHVKNINRMNIGNMNIEIQLAQYRLKEVLGGDDQEYIDDLKLVINKLESALNNCFNYDKIIDNTIKTIDKIKNGKTI